MDEGLLGTGVLAIWNGIAPGKERDFVRWHVREHIPERIGVPGFLRARRYFALEGEPAYFNFYEVETPAVLSSPAYVERLDNPSELTRSIVPHFVQTSRTLCAVAASRGNGVAGSILTLRFDAPLHDAASLVDQLVAHPDVAAAHVLRRVSEGAVETNESKMRAERDGSSATIVLVEGACAEALREIGRTIASPTSSDHFHIPAAAHRGLYHLDYLLARPTQG